MKKETAKHVLPSFQEKRRKAYSRNVNNEMNATNRLTEQTYLSTLAMDQHRMISHIYKPKE